MNNKKKYGWKPDLPDKRDHYYKIVKRIKLPAMVDLRGKVTRVYDQGNLGSCVGHGVGSLDKFVTEQQKSTEFNPSMLFIYYCARALEGTTHEDSGAYIRDGMKAINRWGVSTEKMWPYKINKYAVKPCKQSYRDALTHQSIEYTRISQDEYSIKHCLAEGFPVVFGFSVYEYFESEEMTDTGILHVPTEDEAFLGGHCVYAIGYNDTTRRFYVQNSWGTEWGQRGFFEMPYAYLLDENLADDIWTLRLVE